MDYLILQGSNNKKNPLLYKIYCKIQLILWPPLMIYLSLPSPLHEYTLLKRFHMHFLTFSIFSRDGKVSCLLTDNIIFFICGSINVVHP